MLSLLLGHASCGCEVNVMAPLVMFDPYPNVKNEDQLRNRFQQLKQAGTDGIMLDVWWGYVEATEKKYDFSGYEKIFNLIKNAGLKIIPVFSFHQCGGNVGDECNIPIPSYARNSKVQPFFKDQDGRIDYEYISFAYDDTVISGGRTPLDCYKEMMAEFKRKFNSLITGKDIIEIEVGVGPCGEARYPSYQQNQGWNYPGCGSFQHYDDKFQAALKADAEKSGHPSWARNPSNVGSFNVRPGQSQFWQDGQQDSWNSEYGQWFIKWYAAQLNAHTNDVLKLARQVFPNEKLACKIAGIHWWYMQSTHCAETTAGFNNFIFYDGYRDLITAFKNSNVDVCFTCLEMNPDGSAQSNPSYLVQQIINDSNWAGLLFEGENALPTESNPGGYQNIKNWVPKGLKKFTLLRMCDKLFNSYEYNLFQQFVRDMHNA